METDCVVNISTKSKLILRDIDLLKRLIHLKVSISINTTDESFKNDMDNASSIADRVNTIKELKENGIYTVLFISPIFPYITDFENIIELTKEYVDEYWFENLNLRGTYKQDVLAYISNKFPSLYDKYKEIYINHNNDYWISLSEKIENYCKKNKLKFKNFFYHDKLVENKKKGKGRE